MAKIGAIVTREEFLIVLVVFEYCMSSRAPVVDSWVIRGRIVPFDGIFGSALH